MSMTASRLIELAERCEQASGPEWSLDRDIAVARGAIIPEQPTGAVNATPSCFMPRFTASLDAAMSLVPKGWAFKIGLTWCELWPMDGDDWDWLDKQHHAATPALALTAACLRALAQGETNNAG